ncbi:MAG TPA: 4Fe-4S dicluster domain-containing protein [Clostridia bacterium]|jgi:Pyruvate/2-oxoacid:ferredoxin oxidoreductase delta subunit|nr:MAG: pyuvate ferredoxin oxidoreductase subunit delta [Firmicutes bacterium ADurb.Bin248]HOG01747.1 4Fe-4S dicluster domain-containing protein [Clostridia bacterium]HOS18540.1 4Fe-4S dicluster domain-containing protein [Clostridia bacterium]HPK16457.1 4Fe-4S dicluster domain-containing protein [Clostridia bacterium]
MAKAVPQIDYERCVKCARCALWCPMSHLTMTLVDPADPERPYPEKTGSVCIGCGQCAKECPAEAIRMIRFGG